MGTWIFSSMVKWPGVNLISHLSLVSRLRVNGAIRPLILLLLSRIEGEIYISLSLYFVAYFTTLSVLYIRHGHCIYRHSQTYVVLKKVEKQLKL